MKLRFLPPMLIAAVALAGCGGSSPAAKIAPSDIAVVGSQHITLAQYTQALAEERASLKASGTAFPKAGTTAYQSLQTTIIDALVQQAEFALQAAKLKLSVTPAEVQSQISALKKKYFKGSESLYMAALKQQGFTDLEVRQNLATRLLQQKLFTQVTKTVKVTNAQVNLNYLQNLSTYEKASTRKVREILAGKNKQALAEQIYKQLKAGASFAALAKRYSQDPGSKNSGGLFTATKGSDVPEFDQAVFAPSAKTGELLAPVKTAQYGWFVIQPLGPIVPATTTSEAKAAPTIRKSLLATQQQAALGTWVQGISKSYCTSGAISYQAGYTPSPDPCASITTPNQTTT
jgi:parvulin-like peptidyl-prolyl isomerase